MIKNPRELVNHLTEEICRCADIGIIGMSGGADSTLVTILSMLALGKERVYTLHMPMDGHDRQTFNSRSWKTAERLGVYKQIVSVEHIANSICEATMTACETTQLSTLNKGNARSRARMCILYGYSCHLGEVTGQRVRVIGTGNLSEDYIGYDTKGGDALCDFFPIGELFKSEVYQLLDYFCEQKLIDETMIDRIPSAGLWLGQTDEAELGYSYADMEQSIRKILQFGYQPDQANEIDRFVWQRHLAHKHKHEAPYVIRARQFCD